jgi:hypothetical protein
MRVGKIEIHVCCFRLFDFKWVFSVHRHVMLLNLQLIVASYVICSLTCFFPVFR